MTEPTFQGEPGTDGTIGRVQSREMRTAGSATDLNVQDFDKGDPAPFARLDSGTTHRGHDSCFIHRDDFRHIAGEVRLEDLPNGIGILDSGGLAGFIWRSPRPWPARTPSPPSTPFRTIAGYETAALPFPHDSEAGSAAGAEAGKSTPSPRLAIQQGNRRRRPAPFSLNNLF